MAVMRVHKNANFTVMSNYHFREKEMSLKAKGLLSLMLSLPNDWDYSIAGLTTLSKDGKDSVMSALKELEAFGYLIRTRLIDERGRFAGYDYDIYEEPTRPYSENPQTDNSQTEKPTQLNTNKQSIKKQNFDKEDKSLSAVENEQPNIFTKELIAVDYIEDDNLYIADYNEFFNEIAATYGFDVLRSCLWYFTKRIKTNGAVDEHGRPIKAKLMYCRIAIEQGAKRLTAEPKENPIAAAWGL
jgi:hypothetical protein